MKSDEEIRKTFKMLIDEDGIINLSIFKMEKEAEDNSRVIELIRDDFFKIFNENPGRNFKVLVDMSPVGTINRYGFAPQTRKIGVELMGKDQIEKGALVTSSIFIKTVIDFMVVLTKKRNYIKIFLNKEDAFAWLKE